MRWDLVLSWSNDTTKICYGSELQGHFCFVNTLDVVVEEIVVADIVESVEIDILCCLPFVKVMSLSISWQDSITNLFEIFVMALDL